MDIWHLTTSLDCILMRMGQHPTCPEIAQYLTEKTVPLFFSKKCILCRYFGILDTHVRIMRHCSSASLIMDFIENVPSVHCSDLVHFISFVRSNISCDHVTPGIYPSSRFLDECVQRRCDSLGISQVAWLKSIEHHNKFHPLNEILLKGLLFFITRDNLISGSILSSLF